MVATPVELLWFDPDALPRIRSRFGALVDELDFEPLDPEHDLPVADPYATRDRHHAFGVLTRGELADGRSLSRVMQAAVGRGGRFTPPVVLLSGELRFPLDEAKALEIAVGLVNPIAGDDKRLREALDAAAEVLKSPLLQGQGQLERTHQHLRDAMGASKRGLSPAALDTHVERALVEQRRFHRRALFGAEQLRALFTPVGESAALPAYLPASMAPSLPLVTRWSARLLAELYPQQDPYEPQPLGLRVVAVGRALQL